MRRPRESGTQGIISSEGIPLKGLYTRWVVLLLLFGTIGLLGWARYNREVRPLNPQEILEAASAENLRLLGRIDAGTLVRNPEGGPFQFRLSGEGESVPVTLTGEDEDTLRELKTIVVIGRWDGNERHFEANEIALIPNYDFITWAYLTSLLPLAAFIFRMERKVALLYIKIKEERPYQAEPEH